MESTNRLPEHASGSQSASARAWPALLAAALGVLILAGAGFAQVPVVHNAAHDSRHAFAFPCH